MKSKILTLMITLITVCSLAGVYAYDEDTPYTVSMNFIVGEDTSFTVDLAGAETTIDFNPTDLNSKEVEPDSQDDGGSTPIIVITNTGNTDLDFTHFINDTPSWVVISYDTSNAVNWAKILNETVSSVDTSVASAGTVDVYLWANFTSAEAGTTERLYQINSTTSA